LIGQDNEQPYFAIEFFDGESFYQLLEREDRLKSDDALKICQQAAQELVTVYAHVVIHRDIKQRNLMLNKRYQLKTADISITFIQQIVYCKSRSWFLNC